MARSRESWTQMVRGSTRGLTDAQVMAVVDRMQATLEGSTCIWHEAASVTGTPCCCQKCRPDIKRYI